MSGPRHLCNMLVKPRPRRRNHDRKLAYCWKLFSWSLKIIIDGVDQPITRFACLEYNRNLAEYFSKCYENQ
jgi:hypothetical protein